MNSLNKYLILGFILSKTVFAETISCPSEITISNAGNLGIDFPYWKIENRRESVSNCPAGVYTYMDKKKEKNKNKISLYNPITVIVDDNKGTGMEIHCEYETKFIDWRGDKSCERTFLTTNIYQVTGSGWDYIYYVTPRHERKMMSICKKEKFKRTAVEGADYKNCTAIK